MTTATTTPAPANAKAKAERKSSASEKTRKTTPTTKSNVGSKASTHEVHYLAADDTSDVWHPATKGMPRPHLEQLEDSIKEVGQMQPGAAVKQEDGTTLFVAGNTRRIATKALEMPFAFVYLHDLGKHKTIDDWIVAEFISSRASRHLDKNGKAFAGALLCQEIYQPRALRRMLGKGDELDNAEKGTACELAAHAVGLKVNAVKTALKVVGSPVEKLVRNGDISMSLAAKFGGLDNVYRLGILDAMKAEEVDIELVEKLLRKDLSDKADESPAKKIVGKAKKLQAKLKKATEEIVEFLDEQEALAKCVSVAPLNLFQDSFSRVTDATVCDACAGQGCEKCNEIGCVLAAPAGQLAKK